jgi:hypothetical protein
MNIQKLEEKFNLETQKTNEIVEKIDNEITSVDTEIPEEQLFSFEQLKNDYLMIRQELMKLIQLGQKILSSAADLEIYDLKAGQLMALAQLQDSVSKNLELMIDIYKKLTEIKKNLEPQKEEKKEEKFNIQNAIFTGSTAELLKMIKENSQ